MIARFRILLPFSFSIPCYDRLDVVNLQHDGFAVKIYPPARANVDSAVCDITSTTPIIDAISNLDSQSIVTPISAIKINGQETIQANLLQIDFVANREFDRRKDRVVFDPSIEALFAVTNQVLGKLRTVGRISRVKYVYPETALGWKVEYLDDSGQKLPKDPDLRRSHFISATSWEISGLTGEIWKLAFGLPQDYIPASWDSLILDARAQLPDVNAAIVLANAALESFIDLVLGVLASTSALDQQSWKWIISRNKNWLKQPSIKEKYDEVLYLLSGRSLAKDESELWKAFDELRNVRNSIVHEGKAVIIRKTNKKKRVVEVEVGPEKAREMITNAEQIISWTEKLLPEEKRRLLFTGQTTFEFNRDMTGGQSTETELWGIRAEGARIQITPKD